MNTQVIYFIFAVCAHTVLGSYYHGPTAIPQVLKSGYLADTHEVAAAKGVHLAALAKESHYGYGGDYSGSYGGDYLSYDQGHVTKYHGPTAKPVVLKSGYLADTHEVATAKGAHLAALAKEFHYGYGGDYSGSYGGDYLSYDQGHVTKYHGPTAKPVVLKSGYLADTHEVAAAKGAHLAALAKDSHYGHGGDYSGSYGGDYLSYDQGYVSKYHGPTAKPMVLKSGYLADTHEVAAAKGAHLAALAKESHYGHGGDYSGSYGGDYLSYDQGYVSKYHGPTAKPVVLKSGYLADTHEVAAAKGAHLAALAKESHYGYGGDYSGSYGSGSDYNQGHDITYHGPTAIPHILKNGHIADTHEVSAAKAKHYAALSKAKAHSAYGHGYGSSQSYSSHY